MIKIYLILPLMDGFVGSEGMPEYVPEASDFRVFYSLEDAEKSLLERQQLSSHEWMDDYAIFESTCFAKETVPGVYTVTPVVAS